ncbi:MAG: hypothetical protein IPL55_03190 [Saprospiraceae bacterium]|jgi:hypothetical protein|nr:hypothetical protein [Saprospiraceae bacterium]MBL0026716.1 hypothetical protein [Saprospiraceae bacterium]
MSKQTSVKDKVGTTNNKNMLIPAKVGRGMYERKYKNVLNDNTGNIKYNSSPTLENAFRKLEILSGVE